MYKQISSDLFKNEIIDKLILHIMYTYLNVCKQMMLNCYFYKALLETITILICKQIGSHLKMKLHTIYSFKNQMYIHLDVRKQMTDI